ncbi:MAG: capsid assembly protein [Kiloniellales bacterium]
MNEMQNDSQNDPQIQQPRLVEWNGERFEVPEDLWDGARNAIRAEAAVKRALDLRRKLSERAPNAAESAPERYELALPAALEGKMSVDPGHPLVEPAMAWARKHGLSQEAFAELAQLWYGHEAEASGEAGGASDRDSEMARLDAALGQRADAVKGELARWMNGLLGRDFAAEPALLSAAEELASTAEGVLLLKAIKDKLGERPLPASRGAGAPPLDEARLKTLQASPAYQDAAHPDHKRTVAEVQRGWASLYPE